MEAAVGDGFGCPAGLQAKSKGGGTVGQQTEAKLLRKQSKAYKKFGNYDANPKLSF